MILSEIQRPIPERLFHYTNLEASKSILSNQEGRGICLWAFSNKVKNDEQEIKMGEYLLKRIVGVLPPNSSLLHHFNGYENTASVSFMEGSVNQHMLDEYGHIRLEFDLGFEGSGLLSNGLIDCEYVAESQLEDYANEYCEMIYNTYHSIPTQQIKYGKFSIPATNSLFDFIMMELDIITKVFRLKEEKWRKENEWRKVFELKSDGARVYYHGKKPYVKYFLDKSKLIGITAFCTPNNTSENAQKDADIILNYISNRGYDAKVQVESFVEL